MEALKKSIEQRGAAPAQTEDLPAAVGGRKKPSQKSEDTEAKPSRRRKAV
jgi:hypothetical protein